MILGVRVMSGTKRAAVLGGVQRIEIREAESDLEKLQRLAAMATLIQALERIEGMATEREREDIFHWRSRLIDRLLAEAPAMGLC